MDTKDLKEENERLTKLNSAKSELISISAHQLRTSLSAEKWILKMFLDGDLGKLSTEQSGLLQRALEANGKMISIVNELLNINHTEKVVEEKYKFEKINISGLIDETLFDFYGESYIRGIEIIFLKPDKPLPEAMADKDKIRVVLQNLVDNAIKYSNYHGKIFVSAKVNSENMIEVAVKDNGIGVPKEEQKQMFDKFFRAENARQKENLGSGIGLFTVKKMVEGSKGSIWFESEAKQGTTFFFTLPVAK